MNRHTTSTFRWPRQTVIRMGTTLRPSLLFLTSYLLFIGCAKTDIDIPLPQRDAITFKTETLDDFTTRSAGYTTNGPNAILSMGVYAAYTPDSWTSAAPLNFMTNQSVERTHPSAPWIYEPEQYWPGNGLVSFFAYAPHSDNAVYEGNKPVIAATAGIPTITYTIAPTHDKQVDLLVATPQKDQTKRDNVTIPLRHALTKIAFSARVANAPAAGTTYRVTQIKLDNLHNSGTVAMNGTNRIWTPTTPTLGTYTQEISTNGIKDVLLTDIYQPLTPATGHLFLLPQVLDKDATVTVTYETTVGASTPELKTKTLALPLAITQWSAGEAYNLMFTIDNGITFIVTPTPWDKTDVEVDIKNRILNVSRIEASVYPGIPTRIYFWSNQPKDSVYVRTNGNLNSDTPNPKQPAGVSYIVNDVFQNLSGTHTTTPAYSPNIVYPGFNGVTTASGEGYIDVWHKLDLSGNPVLPIEDNDKRHVWINASGLARNVLLNSVVRSNPTTTPYVGTFHRWNEKGERIITWGAQYSWTAEVDYEPASKSILLDRQPSPFMVTGQLYSDGNVGDPEAAPLHPDSTIRIEGTGRVYFRVGWNSRLAHRATEPRYGRIKVVEYQANGTTIANTRYLYIRQGELDDYVYGAPRSLAVKWSPYNLTAATLTGTTQSVQIYADRTNATFVQYPTQAGGLFHWVNTTNLRTVYNPTVPATGATSPWNTPVITPGTYWASLMPTHETCPPGYRRPKSGSITAQAEISATASELSQSLYATPPDVGSGNVDNSVWGYYADGFFDRRKIEPAVGNSGRASTAVSPATAEAGYIGRVFYCSDLTAATKWKSLFFPAAASRDRSGILQSAGGLGLYMTSSLQYEGDVSARPIFFTYASGYALIWNTGDPYNGSSIRCVRDINYNTTLPPYNETGIPTALGFDADARKALPAAVPVDALFVAKWNTTMARDFRLYTETDSEGNEVIRKIAANVTFRGTTAAGNQAVDTDIFASALGKVGSSVTYEFNHTNLTWSVGSTFTFQVHEGWTASIYLGASTTPSNTVVGVSGTPLPIVLDAKGRVVFIRTAAPVAP